MNNNNNLIVVLLIALFSLATFQGVNILINGNRILGETSTAGSTYPRCVEVRGNCAANCKTTEKPVPVSDCIKLSCCVPLTSTIIPPSRPSLTALPQSNRSDYLNSSVPCAEIEKIQRQFCTINITTPKPTTTLTPTSTSCQVNGVRRCNNKTIEICLDNTWKSGETCEKVCQNGRCLNPSTTPTPTRS